MSQRNSEELIGSLKGSNNKRQPIVIIASILIIAIVGVVIWVLLRPADKNNMVVTEGNAEEVASELQETVADGMFNARMNTTWTFENSHATSTNAYVANSEMNLHDVYFEIIIDETQEVIYTSPVMARKTSLKNLTLDCELTAGLYDATCMYHLLNDDGSEYSSVGVDVKLNILH